MADEGCWSAWFDGLAQSLRDRRAPVERPPIPRADLIPPMQDERHEIVPRPFWDAGGDLDDFSTNRPGAAGGRPCLGLPAA